MTFNDYAVECRLFEYSNEYFDLMKECSEIELGERYIKNQLILQESAEDLGIEEDVVITESFLMESVDDNTLQAMYEKTEEKKKSVFSKFLNLIKKGLEVVGKWFLHLAGIEHDDLVAQLEAEIKNGKDVSAKLETIEARCKNLGIHVKNKEAEVSRLRSDVANRDKKLKDKDKELADKDKKLKGAHEALSKAEKERDDKEKALLGKNRTINDLKKSNSEKDAEIKRQQNRNLELGKEVTRFSDLADQYNTAAAILQQKVNIMIDPNKLPSACDPEVLCEVMVEMATLIKQGYDSHGVMIKANKVRQITKKLDDAINEQRAGNMTINFAKNTFNTCQKRMNTSLQSLKDVNDAASSSFDSEVVKLINEAIAKISKAKSDTMKLVGEIVGMRNSVVMQSSKKARADERKKANA